MLRNVFVLVSCIGAVGLLPASGDTLTPPPWTATWPIPIPQYSLEADSTVYSPGNPVAILFRIDNLGDADLCYTVGGSPSFEIQVFKNDEFIGSSVSAPSIYNQMFWEMTIEPGESWEMSVSWNQVDSLGQDVEPGVYELRGVILRPPPILVWPSYPHDPSPDVPSSEIVILPEPSTLLLLIGAGVGLVHRTRCGRIAA